MSQDFNPYREWLGVVSANPSPSYYELLGLRPLEQDVGKINAAYQRQSAQLAARLSGSQAPVAQRLMGELGEARMTLMTPTAKRAYDDALAARNSTPSASDVQAMLPPAASPQAAGPMPVAVPGTMGPAYPAPVAQPYSGHGYAGGVYAAPQAYPVAQGQAVMGPYAASPVVPNYYAAPQAVASAGIMATQPESTDGMPSIRRRPVRRRSSSAPALFGAVVVVAGVLGGIWYFNKGDEKVVAVRSSDSPSEATPSSQRQGDTTTVPSAASDVQPDAQTSMARPSTPKRSPAAPASNDDRLMPDTSPPESESKTPAMEEPSKTPESEPEPKPATLPPDRPPSDTTPPDKPPPHPKPTEASPEEAVTVAKALKDVRAALANRDLAKAKDLIDEATIEATAPDTVAQVNQVEMLMSYVDMFWEAVRKTLPKLEAAETIEIDGKMVAVVEADEDHLVVRIEGRNRQYTWQKIPTKIAYYLADRWLARDDQVRNLVLAAFEIVEPKSDLRHAESLLDAASAARLNAEPLYAELKSARGS